MQLRNITAEQISQLISCRLLPLGLFVLLSGMFWIIERRLYVSMFYLLIVIPAVVMVLIRPQAVGSILKSNIFIAFLAFASYCLISISWSGAHESVISLIKRPVYVLLLFIACFIVAEKNPAAGERAMKFSAWIALISAIISLWIYAQHDWPGRLPGYGALSNPLLTSHIYGFFLIVWLSYLLSDQCKRPVMIVPPIILLFFLILATGSRTPLVAIVTSTLWIALLAGGRKAWLTVAVLSITGIAVATFYSAALLDRGVSYRPELWADTWQQIQAHPILGHGYHDPLRLYIESLQTTFIEPHNMTLSVFYQGGLVGLLLWLTLYGSAFLASWRYRGHYLVLITAAPLMYGFIAGMTEGGDVIARPKEHWFLIWIPLALIAASVSIAQRNERDTAHV